MNFGHQIYMDYSKSNHRGKRTFLKTKMSCTRREVFKGSLSLGPSADLGGDVGKGDCRVGDGDVYKLLIRNVITSMSLHGWSELKHREHLGEGRCELLS